jgi:hypothetical protein
MRSPVTEAIRSAQQRGVSISVYFDDFIGSHSEPDVLQQEYEALLLSFNEANLFPNPEKLTPPSEAITAFNCNLTMGRTEVSQDRIEKFFEFVPSAASQKAFFEYRQRVASKNS